MRKLFMILVSSSTENRHLGFSLIPILILLGLIATGKINAQEVIAWGDNSQGQTNVPPSATNIIAVAAGFSHSLALRSDGTVLAWGSSSNMPPDVTNVVAISAGFFHNLAVRADGSMVG